MNVTKTSALLIGTIAVGLCAVSRDSSAGEYDSTLTVTVNGPAHIAYGALGPARHSADSNQYIGCENTVSGNTGAQAVYCYARDSGGTYVTCQVSNANTNWLIAIAGLNSASYLYLGWDSYGNCANIDITNESRYLYN
jgi:hypothetical protein